MSGDSWNDSWQGKSIRYSRWLLTLALLIAVWRHAHWSVALSLTLLALGHEVVANAFWALLRRQRWHP